MSIENKPHITTPLGTIKKNDFGEPVVIISDEWFEFLNSVEGEFNITVVSTINNKTQTVSSISAVDAIELDKAVREIRAIKAQINLDPQKDYSKEISDLKRLISTALEPQKDYSKDINELKSMLAQLLAREQEPTRDNTAWLSTLGNRPA